MTTDRQALITRVAEIIYRETGRAVDDMRAAVIAEYALDHIDATRADHELKMTELVVLSQHYEALLQAAEAQDYGVGTYAWRDALRSRLEHLQALMDQRVNYQEPEA